MAPRSILSLDIGTSKICALVYQPCEARTLALHSSPNDSDITGLPADRHEQCPLRIQEICLELTREILDNDSVKPEEIAAVGFSGQMHGVLLVDIEKRPITNLITWRDQRTNCPGRPGDAHNAKEMLSKATRRDAGCDLHPGYGGATLHWWVKNNALPKKCQATSIASYISSVFSGRLVMEPTHAASWGIFNAREGCWDKDATNRLGIPDNIPPRIIASSCPVGEIANQVAIETGLPKTTTICSPIGDNQASVLGAAGFGREALVVNLGTGGQVSVPSTSFVSREGYETRPMPFGGYIIVGASLCGGWSYAYLRSLFQGVVRDMSGVDLDDETAYARLNELAALAPRGAEGLVADTRFNGTRGNPGIRGAFTGIDASNFTPGNLARATIEGMALELSELARAAGDTCGSNLSLVAVGNVFRKNRLVLDEIEHAFGRSCEVSENEEEAATGAAIGVARAMGYYENTPKNKE